MVAACLILNKPKVFESKFVWHIGHTFPALSVPKSESQRIFAVSTLFVETPDIKKQ
jgi:uncharacterized membrane protein YwaF